MCGIIGYAGHRDACGILLDGLKRLEYRGYDSAGMAVVWDGRLDVRKAVVHNGILENYTELRKRLISEGHPFVSETDTEAMAHLVEKYYEGDLLRAVRRAIHDVEGAFAFGVICIDQPRNLAKTVTVE